MKLYYFETPNAQKPCAVAKYLGSPVEYIRVDLTKGEQSDPAILAVNPNGKIPALADGDVHLWEGHSIMAYLAHKAGSDIWPTKPLEQIEVMKWLNWDTAHFSRHAGRLLYNHYIKSVFDLGDPDPAEIEDAEKFFRQFAGVLNDHLKGKNHIAAGRLTIADFGVASFLPMAEQGKMPLNEFTEVRRWHDSLLELDAWNNPWPEAKSAAA